eukprot:GFUD01021625.1.p1 GENE.GFUD01021625.1~~GFUD01021625.1.p1  ORF type:complete len:256 (+),score=22.38 GFUD01021625.1:136-903(+)
MSLESKWISNNIDAARSRMMADDEDPTLEGGQGKVVIERGHQLSTWDTREYLVPGTRGGIGLVSHVKGESLEGEDCDMAKNSTEGAFESIDMWGMERSIRPEDEACLSTAGHGAGVYRLPHEGGLTDVDAGVNGTPPQGPWTRSRSSSTGPARNSPRKHLETSNLVRDWVSYGTSPLRSSFRDMRPTRHLLSAPGRKIIDDLVETRRDTTRWKTTGRTDAADRLPQVACGNTEAILATWPAISKSEHNEKPSHPY